MKKIKIGLLPRIIIAIILGIAIGTVFPAPLVRIFVTFNGIFSEFLNFSIPLIIVGLVTVAIADIGKGAGKMLLVTALIAYGATLFSGFLSYFTGVTVFPSLIEPGVPLEEVSEAQGIKNPFKLLGKMMPAYFTALGTQSSAATIPVTLEQTKKNGVSSDIAGFVIPLCATIHLSGSTLKIVACALALMMMQGIPFDFPLFAGFIFMLGITMVAAPGVPGGAIMAALGILQSMLSFDESAQALMIALYIAMDSFGTACNVTGDGAIALIIDKIMGKNRAERLC